MSTLEELKAKLSTYKKEDIEFGKDIDYLCFRNSSSKDEFIDEIMNLKDLKVVFRQERSNEERYSLYFIYSRSKGRVYVLRLYPDKIRVITIFPIGKRTLSKYFKRKFKKDIKL